jgi:putative peptidoglycan lipid II flippase
VGLALLGWQIARAIGSGGTGTVAPSASPMHTIPIADVFDFDPPPGDTNENPDQAPLAADGKPDTAWRTNRYRTANFNKTKAGVGLILDLGHAQVVRQVKLILPAAGETLQVRAAGAAVTTAPVDLDSYLVVASAENAGIQDTLRFSFATNTRFLLVWITKLPRDGGGYRGGISEITVSG